LANASASVASATVGAEPKIPENVLGLNSSPTAAARPLAKTALKYGLMAYERSREMVGEVTEAVEDLAAEAKAEVQADSESIKTERA